MNEPTSKNPSSLSSCLDDLKHSWQNKGNKIAGLWRDWPKIAGEPLASNCRPLSLKRGVLIIGASHPQWLQALQYNRNQLLAMLRTEKHEVKDIRIKRYHHSEKAKYQESEQSIWERHPSRVDVHGIAKCQSCNIPSPAGEMALWGVCGFCRRKALAADYNK